jgi:hypothetical protein
VDPVTLALIGAALLAAVGIKRGAAPPRQSSPVEAESETPAEFSDLYARLFRGNLPDPVTSTTAKARERQAAADVRAERPERGDEGEPARVSPIGFGATRAQVAQDTAVVPDVVGQVRVGSSGGYSTPTGSRVTIPIGGSTGVLGGSRTSYHGTRR